MPSGSVLFTEHESNERSDHLRSVADEVLQTAELTMPGRTAEGRRAPTRELLDQRERAGEDGCGEAHVEKEPWSWPWL